MVAFTKVALALFASAEVCTAFTAKSTTIRSITSTAINMSAQDGFPFNPAVSKEWSTPIKEGGTVPSVTFKTRVRIESDDENPFDWKDVTSEDYFKGKRVVLFGLPGAFTPLCSSQMVPGYDAARAEMVKDLGIDEVYCLSVNDAFVMRQWGLNQGYVYITRELKCTVLYCRTPFFAVRSSRPTIIPKQN